MVAQNADHALPSPILLSNHPWVIYVLDLPGGLTTWVVAVKEVKLNYHNPEAILFTTYPYCGSLT